MKNIRLKRIAFWMALIVTGSFLFSACEQDKDWSADYDIVWSVPQITSISSYKDKIGNDLVIDGKFHKITSVSVEGAEFAIKTNTDEEVSQITVTIPRKIGVNGGRVKITNVYGKFTVDTVSFVPTFPTTRIDAVPDEFYIDGSIKLTGINMDLITSLKIGDSTLIFDGSNPETELEIKTKGRIGKLTDGDIVTISNVTAKGGIDEASIDVNSRELLAVILNERPGSKALMLADFETNTSDFYQRWDGSPVWGGGNTEIHRLSDAAYMAPHIYGGSKYVSVIIESVKAPLDYLGEIYLTPTSGTFDLSTFRAPYLTFLCNTGTGKAELWLEINEGGKFGHGMSVDTKGKWQWVSVPLGPGTTWGWAEKPHDIDYTKIAYVKLGMKTGGAGVDNRFEVNFDNVQVTDGMMNNALDLTYNPVKVLRDFEDGQTGYTDGFKAAGGWQENAHGVATIVSGTSGDGSANYLEMNVEVINKGWTWFGDIYLDAQGQTFNENETPYIAFWINTYGKTVQFEMEMGPADGTKWGTNFKITTNGWEMFSLDLHQAGFGKWKAVDGPDLSGIKYLKIGCNSDGWDAGTSYKFAIDKIMLSKGPVSLK